MIGVNFGVTDVAFLEVQEVKGMRAQLHPVANVPHYFWIPQDPEDESADLAANQAWCEMSKERASV